MAAATDNEANHVFQIKDKEEFWNVIKGNEVPLKLTEEEKAAAAAFAAANPGKEPKPTSIPSRKVTVVDAFAEWCGPCKVIAPQFKKWSNMKDYNELLNFIKIDVDELPDLSQDLGIRAMPTFMFFEEGEKAETILGANAPALKKALDKYKDVAAKKVAEEAAKNAAAEKKEEAPAAPDAAPEAASSEAVPEAAPEKKEDAPPA